MIVTVSECGKGVNKDALSSELANGMWSDASNVRFRNGFAEKRKGYREVYTTPTATPYWLGMFGTSTARFLVQACTDSVFVDDGTTRTDITGTPPTGSRDDRWSGFDFNGVLILNNGVDDPFYWNGNTATNLATLTGWTAGTKADFMCAFKAYIFSISVTKSGTKYPYRVMWGNAAEPGSLPTTYTAAATNDAGELDIVGIGPLVAALPYGDMLIVYGQKGRKGLRYVGGNDVFAVIDLPGDDGLLARGCVVHTPKGHVFLTNGDVRIHTGGESISIAEGRVRKWLAATMDSTNAPRSFVCLNPQETEVWICFPSALQESCDTIAAWNWNDDTWSIYTAPNLTYGVSGLISSALSATTWSSQIETWETVGSVWSQNESSSNEAKLVVATATNTIGLANVGYLDFSTSIPWSLTREGIPLSDDGDLVRPITDVRLRLDGIPNTTVSVRVGTSMGPDDYAQASSSASGTYVQGTTNWVNVFTKAGRYATILIEGVSDPAVAMRSYQFKVPDSGARF